MIDCSSTLITFIDFSKRAAFETVVERHFEKKSVIKSVFLGIIYQIKEVDTIKLLIGEIKRAVLCRFESVSTDNGQYGYEHC